MDIGKGSGGVAGRLSNFTPRKFIFDGVECNSIEGVLQSFKFKNPGFTDSTIENIGFDASISAILSEIINGAHLYSFAAAIAPLH